MIRLSLVVGQDNLNIAIGTVICRDIADSNTNGSVSLRRGAVVDEAVVASLSRLPGLRLDVVKAEAGEISQSEASWRTASAIVGPGVHVEPPHQGQCILRAEAPGLLRVDPRLVTRLNEETSILLATALDGRLVARNEVVAIVKASGLWVNEERLPMTVDTPLVHVASLTGSQVALVAGPRIRSANVAAASKSLRTTLAPLGANLIDVRGTTDDPDSIAHALQEYVVRSVDVVLIAGSIVLDPGDPFLLAVEKLSGRIVCRGAPIDPGTMFWVGYIGQTALFGLASCELYGRLSILDLMLPYALARQPITAKLCSQLGYGGLLEQTFAARRSGAVLD